MAGPVGHILCALALLNSGALKVADEKAFIVGTCYPDIQYLGAISRETTHYPNIRWEDIVAAPTDFQKGVLLHSLVDEVRVAHLEKLNEAYIPSLPIMRSQIFKFFEDSLIYAQVQDWPRILHYFDELIPEEKTIHNISNKALTNWHQFIITYCIQKPSVVSTHAILNQIPQLRARIPWGLPSLISKIYLGIAFRACNKPRLVNAIHHFYDNCVHLVTNNAHLTHRRMVMAAA